MLVDYREIQEAYADLENILDLPGYVRHSEHLLRSGGLGRAYYDFDILINDPVRREKIIKFFLNEISTIATRRRIDFLGFLDKATGGTVGAVRLEATISSAANIPSLVIRPGKALRFERVKVEPLPSTPLAHRLRGTQGIIIADHCTEGAEVLDAVDAVRTLGGHITDVITWQAYPEKLDWDEFNARNVDVHIITDIYELTLDDGSKRYDLVRNGVVLRSNTVPKPAALRASQEPSTCTSGRPCN